ncbi:hypothetical protein HY629_01905 [Candidatus Uhrbacteria bacterium]|nr:hypothetical protein [Candidatus Uhrbacteria bacterium]
MQSKKLAGQKPPPTQRFLDISEIRDGIVVLKDGTLRAVLLVSSVNFALKSEDEQNALVGAYSTFLNSFEFPLQIVIQSRKLNIDQYLEKLQQIERGQTNELLAMQTAEYRQYVSELVSLGDIMSKRFYIVVPYDPAGDRQKAFFARLRDLFSPASVVKLSQERFLDRKQRLMQRVDLIMSGLGGMGLNAVLLDTPTLIELYYTVYNPDTAETQKLSDVGKMNVET